MNNLRSKFLGSKIETKIETKNIFWPKIGIKIFVESFSQKNETFTNNKNLAEKLKFWSKKLFRQNIIFVKNCT